MTVATLIRTLRERAPSAIVAACKEVEGYAAILKRNDGANVALCPDRYDPQSEAQRHPFAACRVARGTPQAMVDAVCGLLLAISADERRGVKAAIIVSAGQTWVDATYSDRTVKEPRYGSALRRTLLCVVSAFDPTFRQHREFETPDSFYFIAEVSHPSRFSARETLRARGYFQTLIGLQPSLAADITGA